jgi:hypothetical protein
MSIPDTLGPYTSRDLMSPYDVANALNQLTAAVAALAGGGGGGGTGLTPSGADGDIQIRAAAVLAAITRAGGASTDYLARDNSYRSLPIIPVPAGTDGDVQLKSGTSLAAISRFGGNLTDYLAKDNTYRTIPSTTAPAGTDGDLQVKAGTLFNALSRTGGATSDYLARDNAYHSLPAGFLPAGSDGDIQTKAGANLSALNRTGGVGTDYLARDNSYKTIPSGTQNQLTIASRTVAIGTTFVAVGSGGPSTIRTLAYDTASDGGGDTYFRISSDPGYSSLIWFSSADGQKWGKVNKNEPFKLEQAGGGTGATGAANNAAVEAINSMFTGSLKFGLGYGFAGANFQLGYGVYNFASPWFVKGGCRIAGMGCGFYGGFSTTLQFPVGSDGLVLGAAGNCNGRLYNTSGIYSDFDARASVISHLRIKGGWDHAATVYSQNHTTGQRGVGILSKVDVTLEDLFVESFAEFGVYIKGTAGGGGSAAEPAYNTSDNTDLDESYVCAQGYANSFACFRVACESNGLDGWRIKGADANAGSIISCSGTLNVGWGFNDQCFLGNYWFGNHAASNGIGDGHDFKSGQQFGAYQSYGDSQFTTFIANYSEGDFAGRNSHFTGFPVMIGGLMAGGFHHAPPSISNGGTSPLFVSPFRTPTLAGDFAVGSSNVDGEVYNINGEVFWRKAFNRYDQGTFGVADLITQSVSGYGASQGRSSTIGAGNILFGHGFWLGGPQINQGFDQRFTGMSDGLPTAGKWARGDFVRMVNPSAGGVWAYVCTTGGDYAATPPVWKSVGNLAA